MSRSMEDIICSIRQRIADNPNPEANKNYECQICKDIGWVEYQDNVGNRYMKHCKCWGLRESRRLMEASGISSEFQKKEFDNFETGNINQLVSAKNKALKYLQDFYKCENTIHNSIMFCGQVGSGKTHLGIAICNGLMKMDTAVLYMSYRNAVTRIKQKITDESGYEKELDKYMQARVLFIDDMLKGKITESDVNILYEIVNYRYLNNLPFIISTEKTIDELMNFDEAVSTRIIEMCRGNIIQLQGEELNHRLN